MRLGSRASWIIGAMLALQFVLGVDAARRQTVTHDEYWHLPAGLLAWKTGRFDYDDLNPPLTRLWAALPLAVRGVDVDADSPPHDLGGLGDRFLERNLRSYHVLYACGRAMNLLWAAATGLILARWSRALFGARAAVLTVALWTCCPTVLAHAALVTPDVGGACLFTATLYTWWRFSRQPSWTGALLAGVVMGLAQLAKFTNVLLYPLALVVWLLTSREPMLHQADAARPPGKSLARACRAGSCGQVAGIILISVVVLNAGYLFHGTGSTARRLSLQSQTFKRLADPDGLLSRVPIPLPIDYVRGFDRQRQIMESAHPVFLDGNWALHGFPDYARRSLLYKLPHATQALLLLALAFNLLSRREPRLWRVQAMLAAPVAVLILAAETTSMQLGIRYVLPAFPFLFLLAGQCGRWVDWQKNRIRTLLVVAAALALPLSLRYHPHHLAYFNEYAGGPAGGRYHLLDSNLDWGQDLRALKAWLDEHEIDDVGLAYFGMVPPRALGIDYHVPSRVPSPGWYAVSVNFVMGRPHTIRNPDGTLRPADIGEFGWLRAFEPVAHVGYSIDVYHVSAEDLRNAGGRGLR